MFTSFQSYHGLASTLFCGILVIGLGFAAPAAVAAGGDESGATGANAGGSPSGGAGIEKKPQRGVNKTDLTTCAPGEIWDTKKHKCLERHSGVLPDSDLTEYAFALAKAQRFQEAIDVLDLLAACRTRVLDGRFWRAETSCGVGSAPSAVQRRDLGRFGRLLCWRGDAWRPGQAGARTNIRFRFHAIVTRLHSPRTLSRPRNENWRNPSADLMMPNTGSGVCLRKA